MSTGIAVLTALLIGIGLMVGPALAAESTNVPQDNGMSVYSGSTSSPMNSESSTSPMNESGYQSSSSGSQTTDQSGDVASSTPSGQAPLGGSDMCMGGAAGNQSGSAA